MPNKQAQAGATKPSRPFIIPVPLLLVLSTVTWTVYTLYWFYQNWQTVQAAENIKVHIIWRSFLSPIYYYSLLKKMQALIRKQDKSVKLFAGWNAIAYIALSLLSFLPHTLTLLAFLDIIPLAIVQNRINRAYGASVPVHKFTRNERLLIVVAIIVAILNFHYVLK